MDAIGRMEISKTEEDYLKAIYNLSGLSKKEVSTNSISEELDVKPPSATDMLKRLTEKNTLNMYHTMVFDYLKEGKDCIRNYT